MAPELKSEHQVAATCGDSEKMGQGQEERGGRGAW